MNEIVAKKYVKAILNGSSSTDLDIFIENLENISSAFENEKFQNIITMPALKNDLKVDFLISLATSSNDKFNNLIKLLAKNKRLELIPAILAELKTKKANMQNVYIGKIYGEVELDNKQKEDIEEKFSKKFNANIKLDVVKKKYNGIKVELDELGIEVSFSVDRLKAQINEYILKAI
ncbi:ATP synthase, F1 complex, delta subunit [Campylobacter pinnipediorum subsp. caledonicus]|uniref:ATP synthase subunit delta n=1 Tax=Campylobacter pinnipediorum subsp. caledonicus TaxID=1874362 RepID=A0A1S6U8I8_9BACT|nr:F0F1 ATP synthase subunit delta [Campylobacter pinnipediorum]AQW86406.1 ATP synthase, F1 complex, delta subunit [Campylobacter pinnipediorum subsp. caledonicus]AQW88058.1 ATP synthase, F1 complex, delta subunit [Campylobacter pinnipediorum subsp. caledonicus]OPA71503.1 ATP synthase F1 subunit delta [Campylobacter pinnipediorum subsp. caledonicus]